MINLRVTTDLKLENKYCINCGNLLVEGEEIEKNKKHSLQSLNKVIEKINAKRELEKIKNKKEGEVSEEVSIKPREKFKMMLQDLVSKPVGFNCPNCLQEYEITIIENIKDK